jgi:molecular chaperone HscA
MQVDGQLLSAEDLSLIKRHIDALTSLMLGDNADDIRQATEALNHATEAFAAKRMDVSVQRALSGQDIHSLNLS